MAAFGLAALTSASFGAGASPAAVPPSFTGLQSWKDPTSAQWALLGRAKTGYFRTQINWASVEPTEPQGDCTRACTHDYNWNRYDAIFREAARNRVQVMPTIVGSPGWASRDTRWPPMPTTADGKRDRKALYDFIRAATRQYGPGGQFWRDNPDLPAVPARYWQIWNEPNLPNYWWNRPNPTQYGSFLKASINSAKKGNPSVHVVAAGLPWGSRGMLPPEFLRGMFRVSGLNALHAVAIHPYARTPDLLMTGVRDVRRTLNSISAARGRYIWLTEFGWSSEGPSSAFRVSLATQARYLRDTYHKLYATRSYRVKNAVWFNLLNIRPPAGGSDFWYYHTGLFYSDGRKPKPAWSAFRCVTGAGSC